MSKVAVVGAGRVGGAICQRILEKELAEVVLLDVVKGLPQGKALDLIHSGAAEGKSFKIEGTNDYSRIEGSELTIITAGRPRGPGMSRSDLMKENSRIVTDVAKEVSKFAPNSKVIVVTNPLDLMVYLTYKVTGFDKRRVMGMAGVLDSARFSYLIAKELGVPVSSVSAIVLGGHGNLMVPLPRYATVSGTPLMEMMTKAKLDEVARRTRQAGTEIVSLLKEGSASYGPAASVVAMVEAILKDEHRRISVSTLLEGEYGMEGIFLGVPARIGRSGVEEIIELDLTDEEMEALRKSANEIREGIKSLGDFT